MKVNDISMGRKTDRRSEATDTTSASAISILKQISYLLQTSGGTTGNVNVLTLPEIVQSDKTKLLGTMELSAGSAIIGKVSIDQTTDGTTNKVNAQNATHDNFNCNANLQINNSDIASGNPIFSTIEDGKNITLGAKEDNRSPATDITAISVISILKQISYLLQNALSLSSLPAGDNNIGNMDIVTIGSGEVVKPSTTPVIYNITCTSANTEYSQALPDNCKKFSITLKSRNNLVTWQFKLSAGGTAMYLMGNESINEDNILLTSQTLYFQTNLAGEVVEILAWS
jgi:hypothetical protein